MAVMVMQINFHRITSTFWFLSCSFMSSMTAIANQYHNNFQFVNSSWKLVVVMSLGNILFFLTSDLNPMSS